MDPRLEEASLTGDLNLLHQLLKEDRLILHRFSHVIDNPLHIAGSLGRAGYIAELLRLKPELAHDLNSQNHTPLHLAAANGHSLVVEELLKYQCPNLCLMGDKDRVMPIHTAAVKGRIDGVDDDFLNSKDDKGNTIVHLTIARKQFQIVKFLLTKQGVDVNAVNTMGLTSFDILLEPPCEHGDLALGELLRAAGGLIAKELDIIYYLVNISI